MVAPAILAAGQTISKRRPLSMQIAKLRVKPLADHVPITDHNRSNKRVRTNSPAPALSKLKSSSQVRPVSACELGIHATD